MDRLERPVLPRREDRVRRRAAADSLHKQIGISPRVEAVPVQTKRQVKVQQTARAAASQQIAQLALNEPLNIEVVLFAGYIIAGNCRLPVMPPSSLAVRSRSKVRKPLDLRIATKKTSKVFPSFAGAIFEKRLRHKFQDATFR